jgi:hypothetical protein
MKVLRAKEWAGLDHYTPVDRTDLVKDLNTPAAQALVRRLYGEALT